jgi:hypothetical protein
VLVLSGRARDETFTPGGDALVAGLPKQVKGKHVRVDLAGASGAQAEMVSFLGEEPGIVEFLGHGSVDLWADGVLTHEDVGRLRGHPSLFLPLTCLNGFFHDVYTESMAEALLKVPGGGAFAVWASSGMSHAAEQVALAQAFVGRLLEGGATLGEAAIAAKASARADSRKSWVLFGDPSMRLPAPVMAGDHVPPPGATSGTNDADNPGGCLCSLGRPRTSAAPSGVAAILLLLLAFRRSRRS